MGGSGGMEPEEEKKKQVNDDVVVFLSKTDSPRYNARLHAYVDLQRKRSRAAAARRHSEHLFRDCRTGHGKKKENDKHENCTNCNENNRDTVDKGGNEVEQKKRGKVEKNEGFLNRWRSGSGNRSEPSDRCRRRRRRRRSCRRRRRRSCGRRRRRRRSRSRRRRRRSCRRRRRRSRRRGCRRRRRRCG